MRALVLLLLVVVSFLVVVKFYPASTAEAASPTEELEQAPVEETGFLSRPGGASPDVEEARGAAASPAPEAPVVSPVQPDPRADRIATAPTESEDRIPDWLSNVEPPAPRSEGELPVAATLVHGSATDVRATIRRHPDLPEGRARMAEAFALALQGDAQAGLTLAAQLDEAALTSREKALLQAALGGDPVDVSPIEAGAAESPLVLAMEMMLAAREGEGHLASRAYPRAARAFSDLLLAELDAPWDADPELLKRWTVSLDAAQKHNRWHPKGEWRGVEMVVQAGDSAVALRKRFLSQNPGTVMCAGLILQSNAVRGYLQPGQKLRIPTDPVRMLVDLSARWALYIMGDEVAGSWPVGIGREGEDTPPGEYVAGDKVENPSWMKVGQAPVPFGDPRNPLGTRWIKWYADGIPTSYGFHGTKEPESVGTPSSDGCIRFYNQDVERLFEIFPQGSAILVRE